ncbi:uncharacterized protein [Bemisia tabaci]
MLAIRSSLSRHKVIYRREPKDAWTNNYSPKLLSLFRSNQDIQFILDPYAVCTYVIDYINKSENGMSSATKLILNQTKEGNLPLKEKLKKISNLHYNNSEMSVQEAALNILQIPMSVSSSVVKFIPTNTPEERVMIVKFEKELKKLDSNSEDIIDKNILDYYSERPKKLERLCLADFAAWYETSQTNKAIEKNQTDNIDCNVILKNSKTITYRKRKTDRIIRFKNFSVNKDDYNYYRTNVMLFWPWRDERKEILRTDIYQVFEKNITKIKRNRQRYCKFEDEFLESIIQRLEDTRENDEDLRNTYLKAKFKIDDFIPDEPHAETDIMDTILGTQEEFHIVSNQLKMTEDNYFEIISSLNPEQRDYLLHLANDFKTNEHTQIFHFISGPAGTGKSRLIQSVYQTISRIFWKNETLNPELPIVLLTAPTGKASYAINGSTIHGLFRIPINRKVMGDLGADISNSLATKFSQVKLIIIDEISMVSEELFRKVDQRLRHLFKENLPFGGISILCLGDFNQLPPVQGKPLYGSISDDPYIEIFRRPLWHLFDVYKLTQNMRQNETKFITALNNLGEGTLTEDDINFFKQRCYEKLPDKTKIEKPIQLFYTNKEVAEWNETRLNEIPGKCYMSYADNIVIGDGPSTAKDSLLKWAVDKKRKLNDTENMPQTISLKIEGRYMILKNINVEDGLVNGISGILKKIDFGTNSDTKEKRPIRIWLQLENISSGQKIRMRYKQLIRIKNIKEDLTPIELSITTFRRNFNSEYNLAIERKHFPLMVAEGLTIHKSQGATYDSVAVKTFKNMKQSLLYVALSRAKSSSKLYIIKDFPVLSRSNSFAILQNEKRRWETCMLIPKYKFLREKRVEKQLVFHNVQSYNKHKQEVWNNEAFIKSDFILLGETWTLQSDDISNNVFTCLSRVDGHMKRQANGCCCLVSNKISKMFQEWHSSIIINEKGSLSISSIKSKELLIVCVYKSPNFPINSLDSLFYNIKTDDSKNKIIAGDFNININNQNATTSKFRQFITQAGLSLINENESTTDSKSNIDVIATNFKGRGGAYESVTSFHKPIWLRF